MLSAAGIAVNPVPAPLRHVHAPDIELTTGSATDIVIDFVRHGDTIPSGNVVEVASNGLPGFPLSPAGEQQAQATADAMFQELGGPHGVAGLFGGYEQRMGETAAPFVAYQQMPMQPLNGFDEIGGGIYADNPPASPGALLSEVTGLLWVLGLRFLPVPGSNDYNGMAFDENFGGAVDTAYQQVLANPVISGNDHITAAVYSGEGAITGWTLMNVHNPDLAILLPMAVDATFTGDMLSPAGQVVIEGNPTDGWSMLSFNGVDIPQDPGLLTDLFVAVRNVLTAPQMAAWDVFLAAFTGEAATIGNALQTGAQSIGSAIIDLPVLAVTDTINAVQTIGADMAAGESFIDAFNAAILGLPS